MKNLRPQHGVTLIEYLIVIAIISIMSASMMTTTLAPAYENVFVSERQAFEAGQARLLSTLLRDAHAATSLRADNEAKTLVFNEDEATQILIFVDEHGRAIRVEGQGAIAALRADAAPADENRRLLATGIETMSARRDPDSGLWRVLVVSAVERLNRRLESRRTVNLLVGDGWAQEGAL